MKLRDRLKSFFGYTPGPGQNVPSSWPITWWQQNYTVPSSSDGGSVVEACVQAYAQTMAQLPGRQFQMTDNGTKEYVMTSKLARVLAKPNNYQTRSDFMLNLVYSILLQGNGYWAGFGVGNQKPDQLFLLDPRQTRPHVSPETGDIFYSTTGQFADMMGTDVMVDDRVLIPARYIGHVRLHTPQDPLIGVTPLQNAAASVSAHGAITGSQAAFFNNMSRPSGFISSDLSLTKDQMNDLRAAWDEKAKDLNAGGVPILGSGMKWNQMTLSSQDAQLIEAWRMTVEDISRVFRVPPMLINNLENSTFQNAESLMRFWLASGLGFLINHIELVMADFYGLDNRTEGVEYDQEVLLRTDLQGQMESLGTGVTKGLMAPNEGRRRIGLSPVEGGDIPYVQQQMIPLDVAAQAAQLDNMDTNEPEQITPDEERALALLVRSHLQELNNAA